jgi:hypothetical protein
MGRLDSGLRRNDRRGIGILTLGFSFTAGERKLMKRFEQSGLATWLALWDDHRGLKGERYH